MDAKFNFRTVAYIITALMFLSVLSVACHLLGAERFLEGLIDINYFDLLTGQVANTLIVLSLTSVLSSDFGQAYWVNIKDTKLITPFWGCFIGITVYLLTGLFYSVVSYAVGFKLGIVISAIGATALLVILTFKMISIYFGKEELKKQLSMEYRKKLILNNSSYVSDYLRGLNNFRETVEKEKFPKKNSFLTELNREIKEIQEELDSGNEETVDRCHTDHISKYMKGCEEVRAIDLKIEEYTKNAIIKNDTEIVTENIELLVESENFDTFFKLLEELFDWDEKYTCKILMRISKKNSAWLVKDKMNFFKQYALQKLISQSGKLDAIQNLLLIYDPSNLGMSKLRPDIKRIIEREMTIKKQTSELDNKLAKAEDYCACMKEQRETRDSLKEQEAELSRELRKLLETSTTKELRAYYVPIREAYLAYEEGKYEIVNKYLTVILTNFEQECLVIRSDSGISDVDSSIEFRFSYVTDEESVIIDQLIEKDKATMAIPEQTKKKLSELDRVMVTNSAWSGQR